MRDITIASVNLYNLQEPEKRRYPNSKPYTQAQYDAKIRWTAGMLQTLEADVIAFQELWSPACLKDVLRAANLDATHALAFIRETRWDGIAVAAAVRQPWTIKTIKRHKAFPEGFALRKTKRSMATIQDNPTEADRAENENFLPSHEDDEISVAISEFSRSPLQVTIGHQQADDVPPSRCSVPT